MYHNKTMRWTTFLALWCCTAWAAEDIGGQKQFFIDHKFIESSEGVALNMHVPARTGEILLKADAPWEKDLRLGSYCTILREPDGRVRLWYNVLERKHEPGKNPEFMGVAYAESRDGVHFEKPVLGLVEFNGSKQNNLVMPTDPRLYAMGGGSVWRDENPLCPPDARYKTWQKTYGKKDSGVKGPHRVLVSPDGLHWTLSPHLVTGLRAADTQSSWFWDSRLARYLGFTREWVQLRPARQMRMVSYNESDDLHTWRNSTIVLGPDELDFTGDERPPVDITKMIVKGERLMPPTLARELEEKKYAEGEDQVPHPGAPSDMYGAGVFPYGNIYVSLMSMFHHAFADGPDTGDVRLGLSRDARHFRMPGQREPFLGLGPNGTFDSRWVWALPRPIEMGDELWVYYYGGNADHSGRLDPLAKAPQEGISRAVMRLDGFVSADFAYSGGSLLTPPLHFDGSRLELNLDTGAGGLGRVELLDESGAPLPGYTLADADPLNGNRVRWTVTWKGQSDVSSLAGKTIRLHFKMRSAKLYAFRFSRG